MKRLRSISAGWLAMALAPVRAQIAPPAPPAASPPPVAAQAAGNANAETASGQSTAKSPNPAGSTKPLAVPARQPSAAELMRAAIQKQMAAARQQAQSAGAWLMPGASEETVPGPPPAACEVLADAVTAPLIEAAAQNNQLEPAVLHAIIEQESGFHPCAISMKGAQGLMQLMPDTAAELGVKDPFDPRESIDGGARYFKQLLDKYKGDLKLSLAAYNAGPAAVDVAGAVPDIPETRDYVEAILKKIK